MCVHWEPMATARQIALLAFALLAAPPAALLAQDSYEIQVYPSETMPRGITMFELHSNYTVDGQKSAANGVLASDNALHETLEITHGFNEIFEVGLYFFTSTNPGEGFGYVGSHIRPRFRVPPSWNWPVGVSLSQEIGFQKRAYSEETWSWEIRPIVDKQMGRFYWSVNPTLGVALAHDSTTQGGVDFAPNIAATLDVSRAVNLGVEYYGDFGPIGNFDPPNQRAQQIFAVANLDVSPLWEINFGPGFGLTPATDKLLFKLILGYRVGSGRRPSRAVAP